MTAPNDPLPPDAKAPAPAAPGAGGSAPAAGAGAGHGGGYRDTVESILIAFILAFVFRAFVVEAFVIPTGSMAPTLLGAHARFTCPDCGYVFESNFSSGLGDDQSIPSEVGQASFPKAHCPNCGYAVHHPDSGKSEKVPIHYGDRILVLKYAYLLNDPRRWDVVVFKSPDVEPAGGPAPYTTNFIKRLVGTPGETLMILDGDVYVAAAGAGGGSAPEPADFKVQPKPRHVQDALWRVVYDNDFQPRPAGPDDDPLSAWAQPWKAEGDEAGWTLGSAAAPRVFTFDGPRSAGTIRFDTGANHNQAFTDWLAYAQQQSGHHNVSDARLSFVYERTAGDGPLRLQLTKRGDTFTAELTRDGVKLYRKAGSPGGPGEPGTEVASAAGVKGLASGGPVAVDFANVDYRVTLRVAGEEVLRFDYDPDVAALLDAHKANRSSPKPEVRITAAEQACALSHVSLWRDVYYTNGPEMAIRWARPGKPITLGADEYFVLGDNTVISKDARYWTDPVNLPGEDLTAQAGVVPGRFLLGKAFFVYWPAGYRPLPGGKGPGAIPNFGDMRLIN